MLIWQDWESVDPRRIGAAGFCFGGSQVMRLGTRNPGLAVAAIFYGSGPIQDPAELGVMGQNGPVLGIFGEQDQSIPVDQVKGFKLAMDARGIDNRVTVYPGVGHAFVHVETSPRRALRRMHGGRCWISWLGR